MSKTNSSAVPLTSWPVIVGLGLVTLLIIGMIGLDVFFSEQESSKTTNIIENAQRGILLLNDIRSASRRLGEIDATETNAANDIDHWTKTIATAARAYEPLTTFAGEHEEWVHLQALLRELTQNPGHRQRNPAAMEDDIEKSINRLVSISSMEGNSNLSSIRAAHRQSLWSDVIVGGVVVGIVALISVWLLYVLARQRRLLVERVQVLSQQNSELEAFAGRAAHDLRSPMNPIRGYADLILEAKHLPDDIHGMAQRIRQAVGRMTHVVDDMLALSVSGRPPPGQSMPRAVVARLIEEMGPEIHDVNVVTNLGGSRVACAEGVLGQILRNLIGNAIKFRARSRPLSITIQSRDVGAMVELAIEDNGVGMDSESAKHAFEPFYRAHRDRELPGHGLGLAIVDRTTRALGGTCELSSMVDHSTRIVVRLPRA